jgi:hypothetical protein
MIDGCKAKLRPDSMTILSKILVVELLSIINCELFGNAKSANDLLPKEFPDSG